jgi:cell wall-associated NlpC family hydrolase
MADLDPRINAFRADLAAAALKGVVDAPRFADGIAAIVRWGVAPLRTAPQAEAGLNTQLLYGERFTVYDERDGWSWGQSGLDGYVGYLESDLLRRSVFDPTHRVATLATPILPAPEVKSAAVDLLPMNAKVKVVGEENRFSILDDGHFVYAAHLVPHSEKCDDWVRVAESFLGTPYLWGGKTNAGCDCSGLIQTALEMGGFSAPRDSDMMDAALGAARELRDGLGGLQRGDLVFWKGHVGVMLDAARIVHANAFHMRVVIEPLREAADRIANSESAIRTIKRIS